VCTIEGCGKGFAEHSSLRKHKLVHSGMKIVTEYFEVMLSTKSSSQDLMSTGPGVILWKVVGLVLAHGHFG
jgi:hypothetical protein